MLTPAEADVALFAIKGLNTADIAGLRQTSEGTVKAQTNAIYLGWFISCYTVLVNVGAKSGAGAAGGEGGGAVHECPPGRGTATPGHSIQTPAEGTGTAGRRCVFPRGFPCPPRGCSSVTPPRSRARYESLPHPTRRPA